MKSVYSRAMLTAFLDLLFPKESLTGSEGQWMTDEEREKLKLTPVRWHTELLRKEGIKYIDTLVAAGTYRTSPLLKKAILTFKYGRIPDFHHDLATFMDQSIDGLLLPPANTSPVLCPVPLHWTRKFHRGFNQAELLAQDIAAKRHWEMKQLIKRIRPTGHQAWRTRAERLTALKNAFRYAKNMPIPSYVVLIDDLATTGTTLVECAKVLKAAGVKRVDALVIARDN